MKKLIIVLVLIIAAGGIYWAAREEAVFCTEEAKLCPDGSYVGRVPPICEFAACPGATSTNVTSTHEDLTQFPNGMRRN